MISTDEKRNLSLQHFETMKLLKYKDNKKKEEVEAMATKTAKEAKKRAFQKNLDSTTHAKNKKIEKEKKIRHAKQDAIIRDLNNKDVGTSQQLTINLLTSFKGNN